MIGLSTPTGAINYGRPVNQSSPLARDLVGWWLTLPNTKGGSTFYDLCGRNNGTLTNMDPASDWVPTSRPGAFGALDFDGTNDHIVLGTAAAQTLWTITAWVYQRTQTSYKAIYGSNNNELYLKAGVITYFNGADRAATTTLAANTWYHIACSCHSTSGFAFYVNGVADGTNASTATLTTTPRIGSTTVPDLFFSGMMDDIRVYSRVLSATDIAAVYQDPLLGYLQTLNRLRRPIPFAPAAGAASYPQGVIGGGVGGRIIAA